MCIFSLLHRYLTTAPFSSHTLLISRHTPRRKQHPGSNVRSATTTKANNARRSSRTMAGRTRLSDAHETARRKLRKTSSSPQRRQIENKQGRANTMPHAGETPDAATTTTTKTKSVTAHRKPERRVLVVTNARELWHRPCMSPPGTLPTLAPRRPHLASLAPWHSISAGGHSGRSRRANTHTRPAAPAGRSLRGPLRMLQVALEARLHGGAFACHGLFEREALCFSTPDLLSRPLQVSYAFL